MNRLSAFLYENHKMLRFGLYVILRCFTPVLFLLVTHHHNSNEVLVSFKHIDLQKRIEDSYHYLNILTFQTYICHFLCITRTKSEPPKSCQFHERPDGQQAVIADSIRFTKEWIDLRWSFSHQYSFTKDLLNIFFVIPASVSKRLWYESAP